MCIFWTINVETKTIAIHTYTHVERMKNTSIGSIHIIRIMWRYEKVVREWNLCSFYAYDVHFVCDDGDGGGGYMICALYFKYHFIAKLISNDLEISN